MQTLFVAPAFLLVLILKASKILVPSHECLALLYAEESYFKEPANLNGLPCRSIHTLLFYYSFFELEIGLIFH